MTCVTCGLVHEPAKPLQVLFHPSRHDPGQTLARAMHRFKERRASTPRPEGPVPASPVQAPAPRARATRQRPRVSLSRPLASNAAALSLATVEPGEDYLKACVVRILQELFPGQEIQEWHGTSRGPAP